MARLGDSDFTASVPGVEASDISDMQLIDISQQETLDDGRIKFRATLPSGRVVESDAIIPENAVAARRLWLEALRGQWLADASDALEAAKEKAAKAARDMLAEELFAVSPPIPPVLSPQRVATSADPVAYAMTMWQNAEQEAECDEREAAILAAKAKAAQRAARKWRKLWESLGGDDDVL